MDEWVEVDDAMQDAPICASCGVTALPAEGEIGFVCENPDCEAFGEPL